MKKNLFLKIFTFLVFVSTLMTACSTPVNPAYCVAEINYNGDIIPNGITWPKQTLPELTSSGNSRLYIPCNYRNYIVAQKNDVNYGDRQDPIVVTLNNRKLDVYASAYWMLNQDEAALREFVPFALKYTDVFNTSQDTSNNVNSSTTGWNEMLKENFWPTMNSIAKQAIYNINNDYDSITGEQRIFSVKITDAIYTSEDDKQIKTLQEEMGRLFQYDIAQRISSTNTLFCGQGGGSKWKIPGADNAGEEGNKFNCDPVRIEVTSVQLSKEQNSGAASSSLIDANKAEWLAAYELYHEQTDCWLGLQKTLDLVCKPGVTCVINIDANSCNTTNTDGSLKQTQFIFPEGSPTQVPSDPAATPIP